MADWVERQHPRHPDGRFREKGTADWSRLASERLGTPGGHVDRVEGRDLLGELTDGDFEGMRELAPGIFDFAAHISVHGDRALGQLWQQQGFDGLPRLVTSEQIQAAIDSGWMSIWRAVGGHGYDQDGYLDEHGGWVTPEIITAQEVAETFRSGKVRPGFGGYGNGTYFAPDRARDQLREFYAGHDPNGGALIHAALSPEARTITWHGVMKMMEADGFHIKDLPEDSADWTARQWVLAEFGRYASARGYDAILYTQGDTIGEIVILNRTAVMVEVAGE